MWADRSIEQPLIKRHAPSAVFVVATWSCTWYNQYRTLLRYYPIVDMVTVNVAQGYYGYQSYYLEVS